MQFTNLGDSALTIRLDDDPSEISIHRAHATADAINKASIPGVVETVAVYSSVTVFFDPLATNPRELRGRIHEIVQFIRGTASSRPRLIEIPVQYGGEDGPDLLEVAQRARVLPDEVISLHTTAGYTVAAVGFQPGFGYLLGLPEEIHTPRRATPRISVPAGSVGIGGGQTGVYPLRSPGGWNIVGRTTMPMFDPAANEPARLRVGDRVRFVAV